jgi:hypothetical protein
VFTFDRGELEDAGDAVDDARGSAGGFAAFEPNVVLGGDTGQSGNLLTS